MRHANEMLPVSVPVLSSQDCFVKLRNYSYSIRPKSPEGVKAVLPAHSPIYRFTSLEAGILFQGQQQIPQDLALLINYFDESFDTIAKIVLIPRVEPRHRNRVIHGFKFFEEFARKCSAHSFFSSR